MFAESDEVCLVMWY